MAGGRCEGDGRVERKQERQIERQIERKRTRGREATEEHKRELESPAAERKNRAPLSLLLPSALSLSFSLFLSFDGDRIDALLDTRRPEKLICRGTTDNDATVTEDLIRIRDGSSVRPRT